MGCFGGGVVYGILLVVMGVWCVLYYWEEVGWLCSDLIFG